MAFSASTFWEVESGGADTNGGGFDEGVAGFPTDGTVDSNTGNTASPVFSSASYSFVAGDANAWILIKSGTDCIKGFYKIASVSGGKATLSAAIGEAQIPFLDLTTFYPGLKPNTAVGIATVGTPTSITWGIDYSQQTGAEISFTDITILGTTTDFTSAAFPVAKNFIGNVINIVSGVGFTVQRVTIISTSGTTATCDKSLGTTLSVGGTGDLGGAFVSPGLAASVQTVVGHTMYIKDGTYSITSASTNIASGCVSVTAGSIRIEGYSTVRGDLAAQPLLQASGISTFTLVTISGATGPKVNSLILDGAALTSSRGLATSSSSGSGHLLTAKNCTNSGFVSSASTFFYKCRATGCSTQPAFLASNNCTYIGCVADANTITGFSHITAGINNMINCLSINNTGATSDGVLLAIAFSPVYNCVFYGNGRDGYRSSTASLLNVVNCIAEANVGTGFNFTAAANGLVFLNNATYNNGTPVTITSISVTVARSNDIVGTSTFFTNAAGLDFSLNNVATGGALCRRVRFPDVFPGISSTDYGDVGAIQHTDAMKSSPFAG